MFAVRCPAHLVWHPSVHHSLLLLRGLQCRHTLVLDPAAEGRPSLLVEGSSLIQTTVDWGHTDSPPNLQRVYAPEHILHFFANRTATPQQAILATQLADYLDACEVSRRIQAAVDTLLFTLQTATQEVEPVRVAHAALLTLLERVEIALAKEDPQEEGKEEDPLRLWPLFSILQFIVEEGGLLTSAYPHLSRELARLSQRPTVRQHRRLVERTLAEGPTVAYPYRNFLQEVQRGLREYNHTIQERTGGTAVNHNSGEARMGLQAVAARLPWTRKGAKLTPRN
ncbi:hypothetical protein AGDE_11198 [Angomonas deanei]|nr:hypothetical protein AGDE_11198 [Angomonas deanei]|eukprot:EPY26576.1 hypothetical protein AGDE_11198 [Angomonas deanei]